MIKVERLNYTSGWRKLFYVVGKKDALPSVHCHSPEGTKTNYELLNSLEAGVYYFKYHFGNLGNYVFIYFENNKPELVEIITVEK